MHLFDAEGKKFLDFGMGLRSVLIGYAEEQIDSKAIEYLKKGMNLTRPSLIELEAAELMTDLIPSADMVKFTKNGSTAVTAAVKLARAYTGRDLIAICTDHPFFSFDDWFIGTTPMSKGVPQSVKNLTRLFSYNNIESLEILISENKNKIACVILEPLATDCPAVENQESGCCSQKNCERKFFKHQNFLKKVQELCKREGIVFILDEMITGFRWGLGGAQAAFGLSPDLSTFGKAMANGYPLACLVGKREIMCQGSIDLPGQERLFLISTTHGADMASFGAFQATVNLIRTSPIVDRVWEFGFKLMNLMRKVAKSQGIDEFFKVHGPACSPRYSTLDETKNLSLDYRTLFMQEMLKEGILMPWISIAHRHSELSFDQIESALTSTFEIYARALESNPSKFIEGPIIKPVFRKFN